LFLVCHWVTYFNRRRPNALIAAVQACSYSSSSEPDLKETFKKVLPAKRELLKKVKAHADKKLGDVKVENALGGMRYDP